MGKAKQENMKWSEKWSDWESGFRTK